MGLEHTVQFLSNQPKNFTKMKLLFAVAAVAFGQDAPASTTAAAPAQQPRTPKDQENKGALDGSCGNNNACYLGGHDMTYQCYNGVEDTLCPSTKCYTQNTQWMHDANTDIQCTMDNAECLKNSCKVGSMKVELDTELFHTNQYIPGEFIDLLASGDRTLEMNGQPLSNGDWTAVGNMIVVNVNYANNNGTPTMFKVGNKNFIKYGITFQSMGNDDDSSSMIEFFVDHKVTADCVYPADIDIEADGFWINQEDVEMATEGTAELKKQFDCKFYADSARSDQIMAHNIVNMGEMLYAEVDSKPLHGLGYHLTGVQVSDPQNAANVYEVADAANVATVSYSVNPTSSKSPTGANIFFQYLSFGFETYGVPNGNQNEVNVKCNVELYVLP